MEAPSGLSDTSPVTATTKSIPAPPGDAATTFCSPRTPLQIGKHAEAQEKNHASPGERLLAHAAATRPAHARSEPPRARTDAHRWARAEDGLVPAPGDRHQIRDPRWDRARASHRVLAQAPQAALRAEPAGRREAASAPAAGKSSPCSARDRINEGHEGQAGLRGVPPRNRQGAKHVTSMHMPRGERRLLWGTDLHHQGRAACCRPPGRARRRLHFGPPPCHHGLPAPCGFCSGFPDGSPQQDRQTARPPCRQETLRGRRQARSGNCCDSPGRPAYLLSTRRRHRATYYPFLCPPTSARCQRGQEIEQIVLGSQRKAKESNPE